MKGHQVRIAGETVTLRPPEISDLELFFRLASDEKTAELSDDQPFIKTDIKRFTAYYQRYLMPAAENYLPFVICDADSDAAVGQIHAGNMSIHHKNCMIGFQILPEFRRRGYCADAIETLLDYLYYDLQMERVAAEVYEFNTASLHLLLGCGFQTEGRLRSWLKRYGKRWDKILLSQLRSEWEQDFPAEAWRLSSQIVFVFDKSNFLKRLENQSLEEQTKALQEFYEESALAIESYGGEMIRFIADSGIAVFNPQLKEKLGSLQKIFNKAGCKTAWSEGEIVIGSFGYGDARQKDILGAPVNEAFKKLNQTKKGE
jgi:RimJ/RimL family protein N-acetyltransferase